MKVLYCTVADNIENLKTKPSAFTSSKIKTLYTKTNPCFIKEFLSISNIEYINVQKSPRFSKIWNDMMTKRVFKYNYKDFDSQKIFDEYRKFNMKIACEINDKCSESDLVIVNDSSLLLLADMVKCKVAIRNLKFDHCFIERVPFHKEVLKALFKAQKFFINKFSLDSFKKYINETVIYYKVEHGGCWYLEQFVDKLAVLNVIKECKNYRKSLQDRHHNCKRSLEKLNISKNSKLDDAVNKGERIREYCKNVSKNEDQVIVTNASLLHLEAYIKEYPKTVIKYIRDVVEINEEQSRMKQYLKKVYNCRIETIDTNDTDLITLELLFCDMFVGTKYNEMAKLLRKPQIEDITNPVELVKEIRSKIGKMTEVSSVYSEGEYLKVFMAINGYELVENESEEVRDERINQILDEIYVGNSNKDKEAKPCERMCSMTQCPMNDCLKNECPSKCDKNECPIDSERNRNEYPSECDKNECPSKCDKNECPVSCPMNECDKEKCDKNECPINSESNRKECPMNECNMNQCDMKDQNDNKKLAQPDKLNREKFLKFWEKSNKIMLVDYDGTLAKIEKEPSLAKPSSELIELLKNCNKKFRLVVCTGRSEKVVDEWFPNEIEVYAEHGAMHRLNGKWELINKINCIDECEEVMKYYAERTPNSIVERKSCGVTFHHRMVELFDNEKLYNVLRRVAGERVTLGKKVIEVRSMGKDSVSLKVNPAVCAGDDFTDEDMFKVCSGTSIKIGKGKTKANYYVEDVPEFLDLLKFLIK